MLARTLKKKEIRHNNLDLYGCDEKQLVNNTVSQFKKLDKATIEKVCITLIRFLPTSSKLKIVNSIMKNIKNIG